MKRTSNWRDISRPQLQAMLAVLKDLTAPATVGDLRRELIRRGVTIEAIPTVVWEIGQNSGYTTSGGVRFPDGTWRYWLISAPGWKQPFPNPEWYEQKKNTAKAEPGSTVTTSVQPCSIEQEPGAGIQAPEQGPRSCRQCGNTIGPDGPPFCDNDGACRNAFLGIKGQP